MKDVISVSVLIGELIYQAHFSPGLINKWIHHVGNFSELCVGALAQLTFLLESCTPTHPVIILRTWRDTLKMIIIFNYNSMLATSP